MIHFTHRGGITLVEMPNVVWKHCEVVGDFVLKTKWNDDWKAKTWNNHNPYFVKQERQTP